MDHLVGNYLSAQSRDRPARSAESRQSLLIVETRRCFWLPLVIKNAHQEFSNWELWVMGPKSVLEFVARECPGITFRGISVDFPPRCSPATFSACMFSPQLWDLFETDYVMIFQLDTVFAPDAARKLPPLDKDFYGASCGPGGGVINGGLSLRRAKAFRRACDLLTEDDKTQPEDVAFCRVMRRHPDFRLPSVRECMAFAIESYGDPFTAVGIHGTDKGYAPPALYAAMLCTDTYIDVVPYDGEPILETRLKLLWNVVETFVIVEARYSHSGLPKQLAFDAEKYEPYMSKIRYVVIDEFPPVMPGYERGKPWIRPESVDAWWREMYQRDYFLGIPDLPVDARYIVSDVDEIPDPYVLATHPFSGVTHLDMAFLVGSPEWQKREVWHRAFVSVGKPTRSPTEIRCSPSTAVPNAGWHCSSFFDVDAQLRKLRHYAHREHADQTDPEVIRHRLEHGKDPYGRSAEFDCFRTPEFNFLNYLK